MRVSLPKVALPLTVERRESDWITFSVSVKIGMTPEQQALGVYQADVSTTRKYGERDWDLVITQQFCNIRGDIQVKSAGQGTTFTMRLPEQLQAPESERAEFSGVL